MARIAVERMPARWASWLQGAVSVEMLVGATAAIAAVYFAAAGLLQHLSFHSYGWDLGIFDQILWSATQGRPFDYSFRGYVYLGDHFQPLLILLAPTAWLDAGPVPLLVIQGFALGAAVIPLFAATRRLAGGTAAWSAVAAYIFSLAIARAVANDFHPECFIPLLAFSALWALTVGRTREFVLLCAALLLMKEDMSLLVLGLCAVAWLEFGEAKLARNMAIGAVVYTAMISLLVMPVLVGSNDTNPMQERYMYLGDDPFEILATVISRPDIPLGHIFRISSLEATLLLLASVAFLPLLAPRLFPTLALLLLEPFLADHGAQPSLEQHYMIVPATFALIMAVIVLGARPWERLDRLPKNSRGLAAAGGLMVASAIVLFVAASPIPPSLSADASQFQIDDHSQIATSVVDQVPDAVPVSAQATFVPHLSQRRHIYEFPRVGNAQWVLLDGAREIPEYDLANGFYACRDELESLGFSVIREEDGITLWYRESVQDTPSSCGFP